MECTKTSEYPSTFATSHFSQATNTHAGAQQLDDDLPVTAPKAGPKRPRQPHSAPTAPWAATMPPRGRSRQPRFTVPWLAMRALDFDNLEEAEGQQRSPPEGFRRAASRDALAWWEEEARAFLTAATFQAVAAAPGVSSAPSELTGFIRAGQPR